MRSKMPLKKSMHEPNIYMQMLALRNPKAHENLNVSEDNAMRQLMFASMIIYKIDEGVVYSGSTQ
ncbi:MAG: TIGR02391 family protein [Bacteroidales bacterium]|nr:TIGR02391 family protein [Clostridium sp.]MCM1203999.1 TIGR02391 family protein [Bacteroidales bacterium]